MVRFHKALPNVKSAYVTRQTFTPDLQKIYTDISVVSVTLCNSDCILHSACYAVHTAQQSKASWESSSNPSSRGVALKFQSPALNYYDFDWKIGKQNYLETLERTAHVGEKQGQGNRVNSNWSIKFYHLKLCWSQFKFEILLITI